MLRSWGAGGVETTTQATCQLLRAESGHLEKLGHAAGPRRNKRNFLQSFSSNVLPKRNGIDSSSLTSLRQFGFLRWRSLADKLPLWAGSDIAGPFVMSACCARDLSATAAPDCHLLQRRK